MTTIDSYHGQMLGVDYTAAKLEVREVKPLVVKEQPPFELQGLTRDSSVGLAQCGGLPVTEQEEEAWLQKQSFLAGCVA